MSGVSLGVSLESIYSRQNTERAAAVTECWAHAALRVLLDKMGQNDQHQTQSETQRLTATGANVRFNISNDIQPGHVITSNQSEARTQPPVDPTLH